MTAHPCFHQSVRFFWVRQKSVQKASPCLGIDPPLFRGTNPLHPSIRFLFVPRNEYLFSITTL